MDELSGPFDAADPEAPDPPYETLDTAGWERLLGDVADGIIGAPGAAAYGASATGTRGVAIAAGTALSRAHWHTGTGTAKTLTSAANATSSSRVDRAVLRVNRPTKRVTVELVTGTAGGGIPALADTSDVTERPLWRWTITPGATVVSGLTDERQWLGAMPRPCTSTSRPTNPRAGQLAYETDTGALILWSGTAWRTLWTDTGRTAFTLNGVNSNAWAQENDNYVRRVNDTVHFRLTIRRWTTSQLGTADPDGSIPLVLPATFRPSTTEMGSGLHSRSPVSMFIYPDGVVRIFPLIDNLPAGRLVYLTATWMTGG